MITVLRLAAASTAGCGLVLHLLNLAFLAWAGTAGAADELGLAGGGLLPQALTVLPWGVGFSGLALAMVVRIGDRHEVLIAALFLGVYSLWGGVLFPLPLRGEAWLPAASMILDGFTHAIGIRFTQVFPRPLADDDLRDLGSRPLRPVVLPLLTALLKPRVYWSAALAFEASVHLLPVDLVPGAGHLLVWLALGTTYMYASYRGGSPEDQRRIFWILEGVLVFLVAEFLLVGLRVVSAAGLLEVDLRAWYVWTRAASAWGTVACFFLAIFHAGAFDAGMALRRTTVASISGGAVLVLFVTLETGLEELLAGMLGLESRAGAVISGVIAALAFQPLFGWIDRTWRRNLEPEAEAKEGPDSGASGASRDSSPG